MRTWTLAGCPLPSFCAALTEHHTADDAIAFPALTEQRPELRSMLEAMSQDHER
jgi:Hemerythrin HHE cation binding domain